MEHVIEVENIRRGGRASTTRGAPGKLDGVSAVAVDIAASRVTVSAAGECRGRPVAALPKHGDPERGSAADLQAAAARSLVSCAIGELG